MGRQCKAHERATHQICQQPLQKVIECSHFRRNQCDVISIGIIIKSNTSHDSFNVSEIRRTQDKIQINTSFQYFKQNFRTADNAQTRRVLQQYPALCFKIEERLSDRIRYYSRTNRMSGTFSRCACAPFQPIHWNLFCYHIIFEMILCFGRQSFFFIWRNEERS